MSIVLSKKISKLSWESTAAEMAASGENWDDWRGVEIDGLEFSRPERCALGGGINGRLTCAELSPAPPPPLQIHRCGLASRFLQAR